DLMTKINAAQNNLDELRRLKAEGERLSSGGSSQPNPEPSQELVTTGQNPGTLVPSSNERALVLVSETEQPRRRGQRGKLPEPLVRPPRSPRSLRIQLIAHNTKVRPVLEKYMESRGQSAAYNFYFDKRDARKLYEAYFKGNALGLTHITSPVRAALNQLA